MLLRETFGVSLNIDNWIVSNLNCGFLNLLSIQTVMPNN